MTDVSQQPRRPRRSERVGDARTMPWRRVLGLMAASLAIWLLLDATTLQHNAQVSPVGARRTVALTILGPVAETSRILQVSRIESVANGLLGRNGNQPGSGHTFSVAGPATSPKKKVSPTKPGETTTTIANAADHPTAADPLRVLILGDSLGLDLGGSLQNQLANTGVVAATLDGKEATGLVRPDYFNWPAELAKDLPAVNPQVVVVMIGANDGQDFPGPPDIPFGSQEWSNEYYQRVVSFMRQATSTGARLIWVGVPPMQNPALNAQVQLVNEIQQTAAESVPGVIYVSSAPILGNAQGQFTPFVTNGGQVVNVREPDGIHVTPAGGVLLGNAVIWDIQNLLHISIPS